MDLTGPNIKQEITTPEEEEVAVLEEISELEEDISMDTSFCDQKLVSTLMEMFPDASPNFIRRMCIGYENNPTSIDSLLNKMLDGKCGSHFYYFLMR